MSWQRALRAYLIHRYGSLALAAYEIGMQANSISNLFQRDNIETATMQRISSALGNVYFAVDGDGIELVIDDEAYEAKVKAA